VPPIRGVRLAVRPHGGVQVSRRARRAGVIERESHPINGVLNHAL
jgi:hypothetical protein